jgi:hypothetical protein
MDSARDLDVKAVTRLALEEGIELIVELIFSGFDLDTQALELIVVEFRLFFETDQFFGHPGQEVFVIGTDGDLNLV